MPRLPPSTDDLEAAELELQRAMVHADADTLEAIIDDEATISWPDGEPAPKHEQVAAYRSGRLRVRRIDVERLRLRVLQELGLTFVWARVEGERDGRPFDQRLRITRTWQLTDQWRLVASHAGPAEAHES